MCFMVLELQALFGVLLWKCWKFAVLAFLLQSLVIWFNFYNLNETISAWNLLFAYTKTYWNAYCTSFSYFLSVVTNSKYLIRLNKLSIELNLFWCKCTVEVGNHSLHIELGEYSINSGRIACCYWERLLRPTSIKSYRKLINQSLN